MRADAGFSLQANSHQDAMQRASQLQTSFFKTMTGVSFYLYLALAAAFVLLVGVGLWREKVFGRSLLTALGLLSFLGILLLTVPLGENYAWAQTPGNRLNVIFEWLSYRATWVIGTST